MRHACDLLQFSTFQIIFAYCLYPKQIHSARVKRERSEMKNQKQTNEPTNHSEIQSIIQKMKQDEKSHNKEMKNAITLCDSIYIVCCVLYKYPFCMQYNHYYDLLENVRSLSLFAACALQNKLIMLIYFYVSFAVGTCSCLSCALLRSSSICLEWVHYYLSTS